jgi:hypothetical protein
MARKDAQCFAGLNRGFAVSLLKTQCKSKCDMRLGIFGPEFQRLPGLGFGFGVVLQKKSPCVREMQRRGIGCEL